MSNLEKKASYYTNLHTITSKYGTSRQGIALNFKVSTLLKELETNDFVKSLMDKQIQFIQPTKVEDVILMLQQFDVVFKRTDNQDSELSSDKAWLYEDAVEFIEPTIGDDAKQMVQSLGTCEIEPSKNMRHLQIMDDRIRLLKFEDQKTEEVKTCVVAV
ncbi:hypothetical protein DPMN_062118 [Dreissena polymorpha]|uniref:Uncharacterized protein n=1 Tax=Dreissena polymorpha TaxID=45954 RepID=A0A9D4C8W4_DREPO|nr:hypothetical protein DPMN_062118 [Dreissena polymorpha]